MSNMSYCRFHNTRGDLGDCLWALSEENEYKISSEEVSRGKAMFRDFLEFCENEGIIEGYDPEEIQRVFNDHNDAVE